MKMIIPGLGRASALGLCAAIAFSGVAFAHDTDKGHPATVEEANSGKFGEVLETYEENGALYVVLDQDGFPGISPGDTAYVDETGDGTFERHEPYW